MAGIVIRPRSRIFHGHDWVYSSEVQKTFGNPKPGDVITLKDFKDRPLGSAIYNPDSQIIARRISRRKQDLDADFFRRRFQRAIELRERAEGVDPELCRLVWSEADGLPGVVIDRYGDHVVLQTLTLAMDQRKQLIAKTLVDLLNPASVIERNDSPIRKAEGLELVTGCLHGEVPEPFPVQVKALDLSLTATLGGGQKTGLYLDQLDSYAAVAKLAKGRRVLDMFCNQGGFALACAKAGAESVRAVDIAEEAVEIGRQNAARESLDIDFRCANAFDFLKAETTRDGEGDEDAQYDMVILDPPSFTRNKKALNEALRGYKEIHLRALKLLRPGGILATYACSYHVNWAVFLDVVNRASVDAKKNLRLIDRHGQRPDHPVIATLPETEYLKGYVFETMPSW